MSDFFTSAPRLTRSSRNLGLSAKTAAELLAAKSAITRKRRFFFAMNTSEPAKAMVYGIFVNFEATYAIKPLGNIQWDETTSNFSFRDSLQSAIIPKRKNNGDKK